VRTSREVQPPRESGDRVRGEDVEQRARAAPHPLSNGGVEPEAVKIDDQTQSVWVNGHWHMVHDPIAFRIVNGIRDLIRGALGGREWPGAPENEAPAVGGSTKPAASDEPAETVKPGNEAPAVEGSLSRNKSEKSSERAKFVYDLVCDLDLPLKTALSRFEKKARDEKWEPITSINGLRYVARRYAEDEGLPAPPPRQNL
jgi:hypothetical protein